jgi:hypothetical protein
MKPRVDTQVICPSVHIISPVLGARNVELNTASTHNLHTLSGACFGNPLNILLISIVNYRVKTPYTSPRTDQGDIDAAIDHTYAARTKALTLETWFTVSELDRPSDSERFKLIQESSSCDEAKAFAVIAIVYSNNSY